MTFKPDQIQPCPVQPSIFSQKKIQEMFFFGGGWQDTQTVVYTTGSYVIREVCCEFCDNKLGTDRLKHHEKIDEHRKMIKGIQWLIRPY